MRKTYNQLNKRQEAILGLFEKHERISSALLVRELPDFSRITVIRDLNLLLKNKFIERQGAARAANYRLADQYRLLRPINIESYFKIEPDKRAAKERFDFAVFGRLPGLFLAEEEKRLNSLVAIYRENLKKIPAKSLKKEFERLAIEMSWKSSKIEGNTYSLLETEALIKKGQKAAGHSRGEAVMILNHKKALDYIRSNSSDYKNISIAKIADLHSLLVKGLGIKKGLRKAPVRVVGTKYRPLDNQHQIREAMERTCQIVNQEKNPFAQALILMILIAYIQPFADGNKRTGRLAANAVLLANNLCPLSYRSVDEIEYKKAVILFYEQNNASYFKKLFIDQFEFAVNNYF